MSKVFNKFNGEKAEELAKKYLKESGYKIKETNFKNKIGEIDIIAYDGKVLVFVEVKYRKSDYFGLPREAVNREKQHKIKLVASSYIKKNRLFDKACRFDVIDILDDKITLIKDCF